MRKITAPSTWLLPLALLLFSFSGASNAANYAWFSPTFGWSESSPMAGCIRMNSGNATGMTFAMGSSGIDGSCLFNGSPFYGSYLQRTGTTCPISGQTYSTTTGVCSCPSGTSLQGGQCVAINPCTAKAGQATKWSQEYSSQSAYDSNPIRETSSQGGCGVTVGSLQCGTSGLTGKFACWGTGTYTGQQQAPTESGVADCVEPCKPPEPTTSDSSQNCTPKQVNGGTTTYTCNSQSSSDQFSDSECAVGTLNGVTGLHCTKPDYVPEAGTKEVEDKVTEVTNPDGSKTITNESTTTKTTCKSGVCTTTTTTTTTTTGKDSSGNTTSTDTACKGDKCDDPSTPKDESEEEGEEEVERSVSGETCNTSLSCEGDAIDCAILNQQKLMRCSMDWETQKGAVLAEAGKSEYQLKTTEFNASSLFSGPSASRWINSSCPADRTIHLETSGKSITFSWTPICDYASVMGYLFVFSASLFFAHYVGRAFGGD